MTSIGMFFVLPRSRLYDFVRAVSLLSCVLIALSDSHAAKASTRPVDRRWGEGRRLVRLGGGVDLEKYKSGSSDRQFF